MKVFLSPDLNGMKFNPPVAIFDHRQISEKKTVLTPIVMQNSITVIDRDANTIVSREACDEGKVWYSCIFQNRSFISFLLCDPKVAGQKRP